MSNFKLKEDVMGVVKVPANCFWGAQTQRALKYFDFSQDKMPFELIKAIAKTKRVATSANYNLGLLEEKIARAIFMAIDEILDDKHMTEFPLSVWQTGSGTQSNMNVNEVIASRANLILGNGREDFSFIHPNDHVNKSQSSNDVFPTAMHISAVEVLKELLIPQVMLLKDNLIKKAVSFQNVIKVGRTHLQDATPLTLGQEISGWISMLEHNCINIEHCMLDLYEIALGGTAVGTGLNTHPEYAALTANYLRLLTGYPFVTASNKFEALSTCNALVNSHSSLKNLAISIMKIANDIRWLSSGPRCGIGELIIPQNEPGSSIMPGKINPTQCESIIMICCQVLGNDVAINIGGSSGNFELNVCRPLIIYNFLQTAHLLCDGIKNFNNYCIQGLEPNYKRIDELLNSSLMLVTAFSPHIGYDKSAKIAQMAYQDNLTLKEAALKSGYLTEKEFNEWIILKNMVGPMKNND